MVLTPKARVSTQPFRYGESFLVQEIWIEEFGLITRSAVAEDGDNSFSGAQFFGQANCTSDVDPGGTPEAQSFFLKQLKANRQCLSIGNLEGVIHDRVFQVGGDPSLTDAFGNRISPGAELTLGIIGKKRGTQRDLPVQSESQDSFP